jgi:hypothetical protein
VALNTINPRFELPEYPDVSLQNTVDILVLNMEPISHVFTNVPPGYLLNNIKETYLENQTS